MDIKLYEEFFLNEEEAKHIEDIEIDDGSDKEHDKELNKMEQEDVDTCPRCGEMEQDCECQDTDYWSTQTMHRVEKGKTKPKQEFKKD